MIKKETNKYMQEAINQAREGINNQCGGPFGCVIVKDDVIVGKGHNNVLKKLNPTLHGEVEAIAEACKTLGTYDLTGCDLYTTGEPCHMCLCATMWANIRKVYYGCTIADNGMIGFRDDKFDGIFGGREKLGDYMEELDREACLELFDEYLKLNHIIY